MHIKYALPPNRGALLRENTGSRFHGHWHASCRRCLVGAIGEGV